MTGGDKNGIRFCLKLSNLLERSMKGPATYWSRQDPDIIWGAGGKSRLVGVQKPVTLRKGAHRRSQAYSYGALGSLQ